MRIAYGASLRRPYERLLHTRKDGRRLPLVASRVRQTARARHLRQRGMAGDALAAWPALLRTWQTLLPL
jgi:hypothetical protein